MFNIHAHFHWLKVPVKLVLFRANFAVVLKCVCLSQALIITIFGTQVLGIGMTILVNFAENPAILSCFR